MIQEKMIEEKKGGTTNELGVLQKAAKDPNDS